MTFADLGLIEPLQRALAREGYAAPTPIQLQAIPPLLEGRDLIGIAQTGTGKTAAFVLPILQRMAAKPRAASPGAPRVLVLVPTRELAAQIDHRFSAYGRFLPFKHATVFGGVDQWPQIGALRAGVDILVATPGRLLDLMRQGHASLKAVEFFVLDEADRMLDMGFLPDVREVVSALPHRRQSLFFSATMPPKVSELAAALLTDPVHAEAAPQATPVESVVQKVLHVEPNNKDALLLDLVRRDRESCILVFTGIKHRADRISAMLNKNGVRADALHADKPQLLRVKALDGFRSGSTQVLVATDIAARGIDIDGISHVINYDLPKSPETYVHRIGRTARAGASGTAYSFCAASERGLLHNIERLIKKRLPVMEHRHRSKVKKEEAPKKHNLRDPRKFVYHHGRLRHHGKLHRRR